MTMFSKVRTRGSLPVRFRDGGRISDSVLRPRSIELWEGLGRVTPSANPPYELREAFVRRVDEATKLTSSRTHLRASGRSRTRVARPRRSRRSAAASGPRDNQGARQIA